MEPLVQLVPLLIVATIGGVALRWISRQGRAREALWVEAARQLGGRYDPRGRVMSDSASGMRLEVDVDGHRVVAESLNGGWTRLTTPCPAGQRLGLLVASTWSSASSPYHHGRDRALERAWMDPAALAVSARTIKQGDVHSYPGMALLDLRRGVRTAAQFVEAIRDLVTIVDGGHRLLARWRAAAASLDGAVLGGDDDWPASGEVTAEVSAGDRPATISAVPGKRDSFVRVRVQLAAPVRASIELDAATVSAPGLPPEGAWRAHLAATAPRFVQIEGHDVDVLLDELEPDLARWRHALELAATLARALDESTPYR